MTMVATPDDVENVLRILNSNIDVFKKVLNIHCQRPSIIVNCRFAIYGHIPGDQYITNLGAMNTQLKPNLSVKLGSTSTDRYEAELETAFTLITNALTTKSAAKGTITAIRLISSMQELIRKFSQSYQHFVNTLR